MAVVGMKIGRNNPCPCGSGRKTKYCCSAPAEVADRDDSRFLAELSSRGHEEMDKLCPDCQTEVWLDMLDLPDVGEACRLAVLAPRPASVLRLGAALRRGDTDAVADELPVALREVDRPLARAGIGRRNSIPSRFRELLTSMRPLDEDLGRSGAGSSTRTGFKGLVADVGLGKVGGLPLPPDVGKAIAAYLRRDRPRRPEREVFLRVLAPLRGLQPPARMSVVDGLHSQGGQDGRGRYVESAGDGGVRGSRRPIGAGRPACETVLVSDYVLSAATN